MMSPRLNRTLTAYVLILPFVITGHCLLVADAIKRPIAISDLDHFPRVGPGASISPDGKFILYGISELPVGSDTMVAQAVSGSWKKECIGVKAHAISADSHWAFAACADKLQLFKLGTSDEIAIPQATNAKFFNRHGKAWLSYEIVAAAKTLVLRELETGAEERIPNLTNYQFGAAERFLLCQSRAEGSSECSVVVLDLASNENRRLANSNEGIAAGFNSQGSAVVYEVAVQNGGAVGYSIHWYNTGTGHDQVILECQSRHENRCFDVSATQLAFVCDGDIYYYQVGMPKAVLKVSPQTPGIGTGLILSPEPLLGFNQDGSNILVNLCERETGNKAPHVGGVNVWSYRDTQLQSEQVLPQNFTPPLYRAVIHVASDRVIRVEEPNEIADDQSGFGNAVIVQRNQDEWYWWLDPAHSTNSAFLVSLRDGTRTRLPFPKKVPYFDEMSPNGKWIVYYNPAKNGYFSYEVETGVIRELTRDTNASWDGDEIRRAMPYPDLGTLGNPKASPQPRGVAGWFKDCEKVLVYDNFDVWQLSLDGSTKPISRTNGYGRAHNLVFRIEYKLDGKSVRNGGEFTTNEGVVLAAYNTLTKEFGAFRADLDSTSDPKLLFMGPYHDRLILQKAAVADLWVLSRSSPNDAPNLFSSKDLRDFHRLTDLQPQRDFIWYTSELVNWHLPDGELCQGILFKPEDFDPSKKYPVIFNLYEEKSEGLFAYRRPELHGQPSTIDVAYFVGHGYLVFMPDIHCKVGHAMEGALRSVESAADCLANRPYVDSARMALAGHSYGGYETNYIVAHSHRFAAAATAASAIDLFADYGFMYAFGKRPESFEKQYHIEIGQNRIGATPWQRPDLYLENSPLFNLPAVTTPILIEHNSRDDTVAFAQGVEFFTALRRLGKKTWMLQYDGEGHEVSEPDNKRDYLTRLTQFFDHYLKGAPPPKWMTEGIPAKRKGLDDGLELDLSVKVP